MCEMRGVEIVHALEKDKECLPEWLEQNEPRFDLERFFAGRTVYYPGSGYDDQPVRACAKAHAAHAFVYVDYGVTPEEMRNHVRGIEDPGFRGYSVYGESERFLTERDLVPPPQANRWGLPNEDGERFEETPAGYFCVLERESSREDSHGPERLAMLFIRADGHAMYESLYCQVGKQRTPPFLTVIHDYPFDENYSRFGSGGLLERIAFFYAVFPRWLLVGSADGIYEPWQGYIDTSAVSKQDERRRKLHGRQEDCSHAGDGNSQKEIERTRESAMRPSLQDEMCEVLLSNGNNWMQLHEITDLVSERGSNLKSDYTPATLEHIEAAALRYGHRFDRQGLFYRCHQ